MKERTRGRRLKHWTQASLVRFEMSTDFFFSWSKWKNRPSKKASNIKSYKLGKSFGTHGEMERTVTCGARIPGFDSSMIQSDFYLGSKEVGLNQTRLIRVIKRFPTEYRKRKMLAVPSEQKSRVSLATWQVLRPLINHRGIALYMPRKLEIVGLNLPGSGFFFFLPILLSFVTKWRVTFTRSLRELHLYCNVMKEKKSKLYRLGAKPA